MKESAHERLTRLRQKLGSVPQKPGVYLHKDEKSSVLYVGKAKNLQARLRSYFTGLDRHGPKTEALVSKIHDFEVIVVDNENESLVLENNLIKHHRPPYNFLLRDDKTYPYLKLNRGEDWPRLLLTRQRKNDGALYFGPFTAGAGLSSVLAVINRFFPLVKCTPAVFKSVTRPCNYYDVKRCLGPCTLPVERADYMAIVDSVIAILQGRTGEVLRKLKSEMKTASAELQFEKAAGLRDQIAALEKLEEQQGVSLEPGFDADIIGDFWNTEAVSFYVSQVRDGKLVGGKSFVLRRVLDEVPEEGGLDAERSYQHEATRAFICQYYQNNTAPARVLVPNGEALVSADVCSEIEVFVGKTFPEDVKFVPEFHWNTSFPKAKSRDKVVRALWQGVAGLCKIAIENAQNRMQEEMRIDEDGQKLLLGLQQLLSLPALPMHLECFDISTFQGAQTVAAGVVFRKGRPAKSDYRRYIIKETTQQDDFASLREVVRRRFTGDKALEIPDCLVIDGGEPQVREVGRVLKTLGLSHICYFGLAKARTERNYASSTVGGSEERVVLPARDEGGEANPELAPTTKVLRRGSAEFRVLTQIRDEAHRFAITFHRKRRDKASFRSILNSVSGLGPKRRKKLFAVYPSFDEMRKASAEDIAKSVGVPLAVAQNLKVAIEKD